MYREALLYDRPDSAACLKARMCLQLKGVPFRRVPPALGDVLRGREMPRLLVSDGRVIPAHGIASYLETAHPEPPLVPPEAAARVYCELLEGWADASLGGAVRALAQSVPEQRLVAARALAREVVPAVLAGPLGAWVAWRAGTPHAADEAAAALRAHLHVLDALLDDRTFLLGRTLTRADVAAFAQVASARRLDAASRLGEHGAVAAWAERLEAVDAIGTALVS